MAGNDKTQSPRAVIVSFDRVLCAREWTEESPEPRPAAGVEALFELLDREFPEMPLATVTGLTLSRAGEAIKLLDWRNRFRVLIAAEHLAANNPHLEGGEAQGAWAQAARRLKLKPGECLALAGSVEEVRETREAALRIVGVGGAEQAGELRRAGAHWVAGELGELETLRAALTSEPPGGLRMTLRRWLP